MTGETGKTKGSLDDTLALMRDLRARCDWDAAQTHQSLRPYLIEESLEVDDALRAGNDDLLREELGDLLLQVLFHSVVAEERGAFDMHDVAGGLVAKMRARHPHLYGGGEKREWEAMKAATPRNSVADGLPVDLPALHRAHRLQDRAAGMGFDWPDARGPAAKVAEELREVERELGSSRAEPASPAPSSRAEPAQRAGPGDLMSAGAGPHAARLEAELGDLLFACVNLCRKAGVHAALALEQANLKFVRRLDAVSALARRRGLVLDGMSLAELDALWDEVKRGEK
ncbi:MAG: nucleoside triphosphate pyrophosphohydrolase [Gemmatimonadetes bacterium]|nr:nucleoside triphosphate pyrophosphohydrolase [Gemmatimonadota bacterium]